MNWVSTLLVFIAAGLLTPVAILCAETLAAMVPARKRLHQTPLARPSIAVIVPAHNEERGLESMLASVMHQLRDGDRVVVVADNCDDDTVGVARRCGATVIERRDRIRRGKGYALDFGLRFLEQDPPTIVIMIDADCFVHEGAIAKLARQVVATRRPAQAVYLLEKPAARPQPRDTVSCLAFLVKNWVRPMGLARYHLPCLLTGSGMAFPWEVIHGVKLASGNIVEDMQLGLDLAIAGHPPLFCGRAHITGRLPEHGRAAVTQRRRWEHGHLQTLITQAPRLLKAAVRQRRIGLLTLALELAVPPMSLLCLMLIAGLGVGVLGGALGASWLAAKLLAGGVMLLAFFMCAAWGKFARMILPITSLAAAPVYVLWKIPIYISFLVRRQTGWVRTQRAHEAEAAPRVVEEEEEFEYSVSAADDAARAQALAMTFASRVELAATGVRAVTERQCIRHIIENLDNGHGGIVVTPNVDHLRQAPGSAEYAKMLSSAQLAVASGPAAQPQATRGLDLVSSLSDAAARRGQSIFLLGGYDGAARTTAAILRQRHPKLRIAGTYSPAADFEQHPDVMAELTAQVVTARPHIVFVGLDSPQQERLIHALRPLLPGTWWLGVGSAFHSVCGQVHPAPPVQGQVKAEWAYRVAQESRGMGGRYLVDDAPLSAPAPGTGRGGDPNDSGSESVAGDLSTLNDANHNTDSADMVPNIEPSDNNQLIYQAFLTGFAHELAANNPARPDAPLIGRAAACDQHAPLQHLRALVLLGGSLRPTAFSQAAQRSIVDLPCDDGRSILAHWQDQALALRRNAKLDTLPVRLLLDQQGRRPWVPPTVGRVAVRVERDGTTYRGTGGVLRDVAQDYADDDFILVANAAQALLTPLPELAALLALGPDGRDVDVNMIAHDDGTPCGLMLIRCAALRAIAADGFIDLKEQALPAIARHFSVHHLLLPQPSAVPIRTFGQYMTALQQLYRARLGRRTAHDPFAEDQRPTFAIVEDGAWIHQDARVHDSVILRGARVEEDTVLVRCVACPGSVAPAGQTLVDQMLVAQEVAVR